MLEYLGTNDFLTKKHKGKEVLHHIDTVYDKVGDKKYEIHLVGMGGVGKIATFVLKKSRIANVTGVLRSKYTAIEKEWFRFERVGHRIIESWKLSPSG